jgi:hypothetical protein
MSNIGCCLGDGKNIGFWKFQWYGNQPFSELFPELFAKEAFKEVVISERMQGNGSERVWTWNWLHNLSYSETHQLEALQELLVVVAINPSCDDRWRWKSGTLNLFSVRSAYSLLIELQPVVEIEANKLTAINKLWRIDVPSKVLVFGWRFLLDKLPTRSALNHRGILLNTIDLSCAFCSLNIEDSGHLFFSCNFSRGIWALISNWIGKGIPVGVDGCYNFLIFGDLVGLKKGGGRVSRLIWMATTWCLWRHRNNVIFKGATPDSTSLVNEIKTVSWLWFSCRYGRHSNSTFMHWCLDPLSCINDI